MAVVNIATQRVAEVFIHREVQVVIRGITGLRARQRPLTHPTIDSASRIRSSPAAYKQDGKANDNPKHTVW